MGPTRTIWELLERTLLEAPEGAGGGQVYGGRRMTYAMLTQQYRHLGGEGFPAPQGGIHADIKPPPDAQENWTPDMEASIAPHWGSPDDAVVNATMSSKGVDPRAGAVRTHAVTQKALGFRAAPSPKPVDKGEPTRRRSYIGKDADVDPGTYSSVTNPLTGKPLPRSIKLQFPAAPYGVGQRTAGTARVDDPEYLAKKGLDTAPARAEDLYDVVVAGTTAGDIVGQGSAVRVAAGKGIPAARQKITPTKIVWTPATGDAAAEGAALMSLLAGEMPAPRRAQDKGKQEPKPELDRKAWQGRYKGPPASDQRAKTVPLGKPIPGWRTDDDEGGG